MLRMRVERSPKRPVLQTPATAARRLVRAGMSPPRRERMKVRSRLSKPTVCC